MQWPCKNWNDWYATYYDLAHLFYGQERISTDGVESESVIFYESYTEESISESVQKSINKEKYSIDVTEHEEPSVTDNPFIK